MMTLQEAIAHAKEKASEQRRRFEDIYGQEEQTEAERKEAIACLDCSNEHGQLAAWLEELAERREADKWNVIRTEADLPKESDNYLIQLDNNWNEQLTAFFSKGVGFCFMGSVLKDVIAWKPLPKPYESEAENEQ